jgi:Fe2+ transport system protein FeoA
MITPLNEATMGVPLILVSVSNKGLAQELAKLGIKPGKELTRLEEEVGVLRTVRLRGPGGEVILSGNMASGLVVHLDDNRIVPLLEVRPGEKGHLEGVTCVPDSALAETYQTLGLAENDSVELARRVPPMEYITLLDKKKRINLPEGMAAKLWGRSQGRQLQFAASGAGKEFILEKILGGWSAQERIKSMGLAPGASLLLEAVRPAQTVCLTNKNPVAISVRGDLRFWLPPNAAGHLMVQPKQED